MSQVFVVRNQHGLFANKHKEWVDGREPRLLFRSPHKDEAVNLVFELSSKDIYLRAEAIDVELDSNRQPVVEVTAELAPPPPEAVDDADQQPVSECSQTEQTSNTVDPNTASAEQPGSAEQPEAEALAG